MQLYIYFLILGNPSLIPSFILPFLILPLLLWFKVFAFWSSSCFVAAWVCASLAGQYLHTYWSVACCVFGVCANVCTFNCSATQNEFETYLSQFLSWIYLVKCNSLMFCLKEHYLLSGNSRTYLRKPHQAVKTFCTQRPIDHLGETAFCVIYSDFH